MRWSYIIPRAMIVLLLWGFLTWGLDPLLKHSAVQALQAMTGAKVDMHQVATKFFPPRLQVRQVALASQTRPGTNLMEFESLEFQLVGDPLLRKQFVIREGRLSGVRLGTARSDDGLLEPVAEETADGQPSWISEKLHQMGDEWLTRLTEDTKAQLDPNVLETWRVGQEVVGKWDVRFQDMNDRVRLIRPRVEELKDQFELARRGDPLQQIEQYVRLAQRGEVLAQDVQKMKTELTEVVPEVRTDMVRLDDARRNDQELVRHKLDMLKPDARRVSESLLGEPMYAQLQKLFSWIELAQEYRQKLTSQLKPERSRGQDFEFPLLNPTPGFLLEKLSVTGEFEQDGESVPFEAELCDATSDAPLLGRPCVIRMKTGGPSPLSLLASLDATGSVLVTHLAGDYRDSREQVMAAGRPDKAMLSARLADIGWKLDLTLRGQQLDGRVLMNCGLQQPRFVAASSLRPEFLQIAQDALSAIQGVNAQLDLGGTLRQPEVELSSDLGAQISEGVQTAFAGQVNYAKQRLLAEVDSFAGDQKAKITERFGGEYQRLMQEHSQLLAQVQEVRQIVASLQSGEVDPNAVFRRVSESKLLPPGQQQQLDRVVQDVNRVVSGQGLPGKVTEKLSEKLPAELPQAISEGMPLNEVSRGITEGMTRRLPRGLPRRRPLNPEAAAGEEKSRTR